jgi:hypothetical protein
MGQYTGILNTSKNVDSKERQELFVAEYLNIQVKLCMCHMVELFTKT